MTRHKFVFDPPQENPEAPNHQDQDVQADSGHEDPGLNHREADDLSLNTSATDDVF